MLTWKQFSWHLWLLPLPSWWAILLRRWFRNLEGVFKSLVAPHHLDSYNNPSCSLMHFYVSESDRMDKSETKCKNVRNIEKVRGSEKVWKRVRKRVIESETEWERQNGSEKKLVWLQERLKKNKTHSYWFSFQLTPKIPSVFWTNFCSFWPSWRIPFLYQKKKVNLKK
jgi:hypothetical protein